MAENKIITKNFIDTFLYRKVSKVYEQQLFDFIMNGEEIDRTDESFEDVKYEVKRRQVISSLYKVLDSKNIVLIINDMQLPKAFKIFCAKDIRNDNKLKVFIDCTHIIVKKDGVYKCTNPDVLIAYLLSAMTNVIYYSDPKRFVINSDIIKTGSKCFSGLFTYIIDYLCKISAITSIRDKCLYLSSMYYNVNILKNTIESSKSVSRYVSGLTEREEELLMLQLKDDTFDNIDTFLSSISIILKLPKLTIDSFLEKWIYIYGTGTQYALELFPAFSSMLINCYVGCYINNQKTIEKVLGVNMANYINTIIRIGRDSIG